MLGRTLDLDISIIIFCNVQTRESTKQSPASLMSPR